MLWSNNIKNMSCHNRTYFWEHQFQTLRTRYYISQLTIDAHTTPIKNNSSQQKVYHLTNLIWLSSNPGNVFLYLKGQALAYRKYFFRYYNTTISFLNVLTNTFLTTFTRMGVTRIKIKPLHRSYSTIMCAVQEELYITPLIKIIPYILYTLPCKRKKKSKPGSATEKIEILLNEMNL